MLALSEPGAGLARGRRTYWGSKLEALLLEEVSCPTQRKTGRGQLPAGKMASLRSSKRLEGWGRAVDWGRGAWGRGGGLEPVVGGGDLKSVVGDGGLELAGGDGGFLGLDCCWVLVVRPCLRGVGHPWCPSTLTMLNVLRSPLKMEAPWRLV